MPARFHPAIGQAAEQGGLLCPRDTDPGLEALTWVAQEAEVLDVLQLLEEAFKPNKTDVPSSIRVRFITVRASLSVGFLQRVAAGFDKTPV